MHYKPTIRSRNRPSNNTIPIYRGIISSIEDRFGYSDGLGNIELDTFYDAIKKRLVLTDSEAQKSTFIKALTKQEYKDLKLRFKNKILLKVIESSQKKNQLPAYTKTLLRLNMEFAAFRVLKDLSNGPSASYIGELIITNSIKFRIDQFILPVATYLVEYFSIFNYNEEKASYYRNISETYLDEVVLENKIHLLYSSMMSLYVKEFTPGKKVDYFLDKVQTEYSSYVGIVHSVYFHVYYFLIRVFGAYSSRNFKEMDKIAEEGYQFIANLPQRRKPLEYVFLRRRIDANLQLRDFLFCKDLLLEMLNNLSPGHNNWFNSLEIIITIYIHEKEYYEAINSFKIGRKNKNLESIVKLTKDRWGLLEAYINFLQLSGAVSSSPTMTRYRINKFINDTPQYSEDKKGRNIQLIIAQLLFYIIDKNWDKMEEKIDALQKYGTRYLRKNELFRSQVFIKMLLEIPRRMYHPKAIIRHTAKYRKRLEEMAPNIDLNGSTLEIIPYEHLWELIIQNIVPPKYTRKTALTTAK